MCKLDAEDNLTKVYTRVPHKCNENEHISFVHDEQKQNNQLEYRLVSTTFYV